MTWIRYEPHLRCHALAGEIAGRAITYCGHKVDPKDIRHHVAGIEPKHKCKCCVGRIEKPYRCPTWISELVASERAAGVRV